MDADFSGFWKHADDQDHVCVKSRTGNVVTVVLCLFYWVPKLQTEISLSTLEAEYIDLSQSMCDLLPLRRLLQEVGTQLNIDFSSPSIMHSTVFEDNNVSLGLAESPKTIPGKRYIAINYHFFGEHVGEGNGL